MRISPCIRRKRAARTVIPGSNCRWNRNCETATNWKQSVRRGIAQGEFEPVLRTADRPIERQAGGFRNARPMGSWRGPADRPGNLHPVAEEIGLIGKLSEALIAQAFADAKSWAPELTLAINISPVQLRDTWFSQKLLKLMTAHNFPPARLEIEITESCLHENLPIVRSTITSLRNQGVTVTLDDFGTGYSSLSQLRSLPFDRLKIDRSFVQRTGYARIVPRHRAVDRRSVPRVELAYHCGRYRNARSCGLTETIRVA